MIAIRTMAIGVLAGAVLAALPGCANETGGGEAERGGPVRALHSPVAQNSTAGEMATLAEAPGVPLVVVGLPNSPNEKPEVRTIVDNILHPPAVTATPAPPPVPTGVTIGPPTTQPEPPATQPATRPGVRIDPLLGPRD